MSIPLFKPISICSILQATRIIMIYVSSKFKLIAFLYYSEESINRSNGTKKIREHSLLSCYFAISALNMAALWLKSLFCWQFLVGQTLGNDYARGQNYTRLSPFFLFTDDKFLRNFHLLRITRKLEEVSPSHQNFQLD